MLSMLVIACSHFTVYYICADEGSFAGEVVEESMLTAEDKALIDSGDGTVTRITGETCIPVTRERLESFRYVFTCTRRFNQH